MSNIMYYMNMIIYEYIYCIYNHEYSITICLPMQYTFYQHA